MGKLYFVCGIPGSGKSSWAEANKEKLDFVIHSSDAIREELGDINDQSKNELVFTTLHKRIKKIYLPEEMYVMMQQILKERIDSIL